MSIDEEILKVTRLPFHLLSVQIYPRNLVGPQSGENLANTGNLWAPVYESAIYVEIGMVSPQVLGMIPQDSAHWCAGSEKSPKRQG